MKAPTFAEKLGIKPPASSILNKANDLGLNSPDFLESLAVARGCWHYRHPEVVAAPNISEDDFANEELAIALLSPCLPYSPHTIRLGAAMLGAVGNRIDLLAGLAVNELTVQAVRYVATAGLQFEPNNPFWAQLLEHLPPSAPMFDGIMPHPTRFVSMTGFARGGKRPPAIWVRPYPELASNHG